MALTRRVRPSGAVRWEVRVYSHGRIAAQKTFERRAEAKAWEAEQTARIRKGTWIDPRRGEATVASVAEAWQRSRDHLAPRSQETTRFLLDRDILPVLGKRPVASLTAADVTDVLERMTTRGLSVNTLRRTLSVLRLLLDYAVMDERIDVNVARKVTPPKGATVVEPHWLTVGQLGALASSVPAHCRVVVLALGLMGLRFSEMAGLQVRDAILTKHGWALRVHRPITESRVTSRLIEGPPKNRHSRTVPVPSALVEYVEGRCRAAPPDAPLFPTRRGSIWRGNNFRRACHWKETTEAIGVPGLRLHDLRHTAASLLIASGADIKATQRILGHRSAQMTVDLYGHLIDAHLWTAVDCLPSIDSGRSGES